MTKPLIDQRVIVHKALELALQSSWQSFSLLDLASSLNCSLNVIRSHFRAKDDIAESLFDNADNAMLCITSQQPFQALSSDERLIECMMCWFNSLAPYKKVVREILAYKFEPGHFHLQAHGITRVSRTVQWFLVASGRDITGLPRIADELAVTSAYLASFRVFLSDDSTDHQNTRAYLERLIGNIARGQRFVFRLGGHRGL